MSAKFESGLVRVVILVTIIALVAGAALSSLPAPTRQMAYIEPALTSPEIESLSVIVMAGDSQTAGRAVQRVGGQVTSDRWLINSVAAIVPARQIEALAGYPGLQSITVNKGVGLAAGPCPGLGPCPGRPGWVTDRRERKRVYDLEGMQPVPATYLPDGGFVSFSENGKVLIVNADGSERARVSLGGSGFKTAPVVGADGTIYIAREAALAHRCDQCEFVS